VTGGPEHLAKIIELLHELPIELQCGGDAEHGHAHGKLPKRHYIPVLYLKQWAGDGRFIKFSRAAGRDRVEPRGTGARGTGYVRGLYRLSGVPHEMAEEVESKFMQQFDNLARACETR
jgi:uncharacterized protein DUF4238